MKKSAVLIGAIASVLLVNTLACYAEKWDKNSYTDVKVESGYYDVDSIKTKDKLVSWTEKYILTADGSTYVNSDISKYKVCKEGIEKIGKVTQFQLDYQIEGKRYRGAAKRYYNKSNELICTDKDTGTSFNSDWNIIVARSPIQDARYDLVTKYKVNFH